MHFLLTLRRQLRLTLSVTVFSLAVLTLLALPVSIQAQGASRLQPRGAGSTVSTGSAASAQVLPAQPQVNRAAVSMTHSTSTNVVDLASIACAVQNLFYTRENSYYRVFKLSDFGITEPLIVNKVAIGVELATPGAGFTTQPLNLKLYTLNGELLLANLNPLTATTFQIPSLSLTSLDLPAAALVNPDQTLVVEIAIPDGVAQQHTFYLGSNTAGADSPSYLRAPFADCGLNEPTDVSTLDLGQTPPDWVMTVYGETQSGTSYQLLNNSSFEYDIDSNKIPEAWAAKGLTKDKLKKNKDGEIYAHTGEYAFVFKAAPGEHSAIQQAISLTPYTTAQNDTFVLTAAVRGKNLNEGAVIKVNLTYQGDEKPLNKVKLTIPPGTYEYQVITSDTMTLEKTAAKIKVQILSKSTVGRFLIDDVQLTWSKPAAAIAATTATTGSSVLPLP